MSIAYIFGGSGFIGTRLAGYLIQSATHDRVVSLDIADPARPVSGVDYVRCDVRQAIDVSPWPKDGASHVYNLAAVHRTPGHPDADYFATNVWGALHVASFARAIGAARTVFTSSIAVYGPTENAVDETSTPQPTSAYGKSKLMAEEIHRAVLGQDSGCQLIIVRPAVIFGPGEGGNFTRLARALSSGMFLYPGRRDTIKSCGYVGELLRAMTILPGRVNGEIVFNFCFPQRYTIEDICTAFQAVANLPAPRGTLPIALTTCLGALGDSLGKVGIKVPVNSERIAKLQHSTNIVPRVLQQLEYRFETDLPASLEKWMNEDPQGQFV